MILALLEHPDPAPRDLSSMRTVLGRRGRAARAGPPRQARQFGCDFTILYGQTEINGLVARRGRRLRAGPVGDPRPAAPPRRGHDPRPAHGRRPAARRERRDLRARLRGHGRLQRHPRGHAAADRRRRLAAHRRPRDHGRARLPAHRGPGEGDDHPRRQNLFPREIEDVLLEHPGVAEVACSASRARSGARSSSRSHARDPAAPAAAEALNAHCRERLAAHKSPALWYFVDAYPLTPRARSRSSSCSSRSRPRSSRPSHGRRRPGAHDR